MFGWFAHVDKRCTRCGGQLGPFQSRRGEEHWGCVECGVGVLCESADQPSIDHAADIYMSLVR
jgi:hypothetical protein